MQENFEYIGKSIMKVKNKVAPNEEQINGFLENP